MQGLVYPMATIDQSLSISVRAYRLLTNLYQATMSCYLDENLNGGYLMTVAAVLADHFPCLLRPHSL